MRIDNHCSVIAAVLGNFLGVSHSPNSYADSVNASAQNKRDMGNVQATVLDPDNTRLSDTGQRFWVEQVVDGLKFPSSMAWLPNGDLLIAEREGGLRLIHKGALQPVAVAGVPPSFQNFFNGLKEVILDPEYRENHRIYLLLSEGTELEHHAAAYQAQYSAAGLANVQRIFRSNDGVATLQIAGRMVLLADGTLLIAVAASSKNKELAQQLGSHIGKIVRVNRDGSIPADNPFLHRPGALPEIWSYGHRVPLGLYQDPDDKEIWEVESGPLGGDELNLLKPGGNFGYAAASWGFAYSGGLDAPLQSAPGMEDPLLVWSPSQDPCGLTRYRGSAYPSWNGDFFVGHLPTRELERMRIIDHKVVVQEKLLSDLQERIRDVREGPDHLLYLLTDHENGRLLRLVPGTPHEGQVRSVAHQLPHPNRYFDPANNRPADPTRGKALFINRCAMCHAIGAGVPGEHIGPDLQGVVGRKAGSLPGFSYSLAMAGKPAWTDQTLDLFLRDPTGYVPGTRMGVPPIDDDAARGDLIAFLEQFSGH